MECYCMRAVFAFTEIKGSPRAYQLAHAHPQIHHPQGESTQPSYPVLFSNLGFKLLGGIWRYLKVFAEEELAFQN